MAEQTTRTEWVSKRNAGSFTRTKLQKITAILEILTQKPELRGNRDFTRKARENTAIALSLDYMGAGLFAFPARFVLIGGANC
jgi:hypothetical protein